MAPHATWKGSLNLSLVSVPVKAYAASGSAAGGPCGAGRVGPARAVGAALAAGD